MPRIIEITVSPKGETTLKTQGYAGGDCREASRFLEQALGIRANEQLTSEFYASAPIEQQVQQ